MKTEAVLAALGGAARWKDLVEAGVTRADIQRALLVGTVMRPWRGCYCLPDIAHEKVVATIFRGHHTCVTKLAQLGIPLLEDDARVHLAVPRNRGLSNQDRRDSALVRLHRRDYEGVPTMPEVFAAAASCLAPPALLACADAALGRNLIAREELGELRTRVASAWLEEAADPRAGSVMESVARLELVLAGWSVRSQVYIEGVGRVDLIVGDVVIELDGREYHSNAVAFADDRRRDRELQARGYRVLRFTYDDVVLCPGTVARCVAQLLGQPDALGAGGLIAA